MLQLQTNGVFGMPSYAQNKNARFSNTQSNVRTIQQRWTETYNAMTPGMQAVVNTSLSAAIAEFRRRNPNVSKWSQLPLAEAKSVPMNSVKIDGTMQRQLDIFWVLRILNHFLATMVVPIQVYKPSPVVEEYLGWDGQHTLVLLWLIATQIMGENPDEILIPVNLYQSSLKAEMRDNFIRLNSKEGKKQLDLIDIFEQQVFGVRVDGSTNPIWVDAEAKQQQIEKFGLFITSKKFGDDDQPGAISRLQEINKLNVEAVGWLCEYLALSTSLSRPVEEKEIVMMAHYFDRCRLNGIAVNSAYIANLYNTNQRLFGCDFSPMGMFWAKAGIAHANWHFINSNSNSGPRFNKEPVHGFPFLIAQLRKSLNQETPLSDSKSEFYPREEDLF
jgi:hypothetical protein